MRLTKATDFAYRVLLYVGTHPGRRVSTDEIATAFAISKDHLGKVVNQLAQQGWIDAKRGRGGGLILARAPEVIGLGEVVRVMEPDLDLVECFNRKYNTCPIVPACGLIGPLAEARRAFLAVLDGYTLADVLPGADSPKREQLITLLGA